MDNAQRFVEQTTEIMLKGKTCPTATLSTTNPILAGLRDGQLDINDIEVMSIQTSQSLSLTHT